MFPHSNAKDMRVTQDLNSFGEIIAHAHCSVDEKKYIYTKKCIFRVYHIRIIATTKIGSHDMKQTDSSIIIVRNVCVLTSGSMIDLFFTRSWSAIIGTKQPKVNQSPQRNGEDDTHASASASAIWLPPSSYWRLCNFDFSAACPMNSEAKV